VHYINPETSEQSAMAKKALCIGINDYPGTDSDLAGCVNDAHDWSEALDTRGFEVSSLLNDGATKASMTEALQTLISGADPGDTIVITFSGHGTWVPDHSEDEPDGRDEGLCPYDIATNGPLLDDEIHDTFSERARGVRILLLSDSCHSGSVTRGDESDLDPNLPRARFLPLFAWLSGSRMPDSTGRPPNLHNGMARTGGDLLLSGCKDMEYSWDTRFRGRPNGAFTYYALKTLKDNLTYEQWFARIRDYLPSTRLPQSPQILGSSKVRRSRVFD
jgi:hypothetical protein